MVTREQPPKLTGPRCQCCGCGEYFSRERAFDRHRVGQFGVDRRCLTTSELIARGWHRNPAGFWVMEAMGSAARARFRPTQAHRAPSPLPAPNAPDLPKAAGEL